MLVFAWAPLSPTHAITAGKPVSKELRDEENRLTAAISSEPRDFKREELIFHLAILCATKTGQFDRARTLVPLIVHHMEMRFSIEAQIAYRDPALSKEQRVEAYKRLILAYPTKTKMLNQMIEGEKRRP